VYKYNSKHLLSKIGITGQLELSDNWNYRTDEDEIIEELDNLLTEVPRRPLNSTEHVSHTRTGFLLDAITAL